MFDTVIIKNNEMISALNNSCGMSTFLHENQAVRIIHHYARMPSRMVHEVCQLTDSGLALLKMGMERLPLSSAPSTAS